LFPSWRNSFARLAEQKFIPRNDYLNKTNIAKMLTNTGFYQDFRNKAETATDKAI